MPEPTPGAGGGIVVPIGADDSRLTTVLARAAGTMRAFGDRIDAIGKRIGAVGDRMQSLGGSLSASLTLPIMAAGGAAIATAARFDGLKRALEAQAGSAEGAARQFERLREVAKLPGLGLEEAIQGSVRLQAVGFSAEGAERALKGVGNALAQAGAGKAELDGVMLAFQQIASKGKVSAEEINQIAERMPQVRAAMQAAFGTADTEALQKAGIDAQTFIDGILTELEKLPVATGGIGNAIENAGDAVKLALVTIGTTISSAIDLPALADRFAAFAEKAVGAFEGFAKAHPILARTAVVVAAVAAAMGPVLAVAGAVAAAIGAIGTPVVAVAVAVAALVAAGVSMAASWKSVTDTTQGVGRVMQQAGTAFNTLRAIGIEAFGILKAGVARAIDQMRPAIASLSSWWSKHGDAIMGVVKAVVRVVATTLGGLVSAIAAIVRTIAAVMDGDWKGAWQGLKGIVEGATRGVRALVADMVASVAERLADLARNLPIVGNSIGNALDGIAARALNAANQIRGAQQAVKDFSALPATRGFFRTLPTFNPPEPAEPDATLFDSPTTPSSSGSKKKDQPDVSPAEQARRDRVDNTFAERALAIEAMSDGLAKALAKAALDYDEAMEQWSRRAYVKGSATMGAVAQSVKDNLDAIRREAERNARIEFPDLATIPDDAIQRIQGVAATMPSAAVGTAALGESAEAASERVALLNAAIAEQGEHLSQGATLASALGLRMRDLFSGALVEGIDAVSQAFGRVITGAESFGDAIRSIGQAARSILGDIAAAIAKAAILAGIRVALGGATGGFGAAFVSALGGANSVNALGGVAANRAPLELIVRSALIPSGDLAISVAAGQAQMAGRGVRITSLTTA